MILFFYALAFVIIISALYVVLAKSIFRSALSLALCLIATAALYLFLNASFIAAIQILIYVGGVVTLILFAIMLTERMINKDIKYINSQVIQTLLVLGILFTVLFNILRKIAITAQVSGRNYADVAILGKMLFENYVLQFEVLSVVLLVALIGAIVIAKKD